MGKAVGPPYLWSGTLSHASRQDDSMTQLRSSIHSSEQPGRYREARVRFDRS